MLNTNNLDTTISLELSAEEVAGLARSAPVTDSPVSVGRAPDANASRASKAGRPAAALIGIAAAIALVGTVGYFARASTAAPSPNAPTSVAVSLPTPVPEPASQNTPVRFANPFDPAEIFEFPSGTSTQAAHDAVAEILLKRGEERLGNLERAPQRKPPAATRARNPSRSPTRPVV